MMNMRASVVLAICGISLSSANAGVAITEVMPDPVIVSDTVGEWFELYNYGPGSINLSGWSVTDGEGSFNLPNVTMPQNDFLVLAVDKTTFENIYFAGVPQSRVIDYPYNTSAGGTGFALANGGDNLDLIDSSNSTVWSVTYNEPPNNRGLSYYLAIPNFSITTWNAPTTWYPLGATTNDITPLAGNYIVPEPATWCLLLVGAMGISTGRRRRI